MRFLRHHFRWHVICLQLFLDSVSGIIVSTNDLVSLSSDLVVHHRVCHVTEMTSAEDDTTGDLSDLDTDQQERDVTVAKETELVKTGRSRMQAGRR